MCKNLFLKFILNVVKNIKEAATVIKVGFKGSML